MPTIVLSPEQKQCLGIKQARESNIRKNSSVIQKRTAVKLTLLNLNVSKHFCFQAQGLDNSFNLDRVPNTKRKIQEQKQKHRTKSFKER